MVTDVGGAVLLLQSRRSSSVAGRGKAKVGWLFFGGGPRRNFCTPNLILVQAPILHLFITYTCAVTHSDSRPGWAGERDASFPQVLRRFASSAGRPNKSGVLLDFSCLRTDEICTKG